MKSRGSILNLHLLLPPPGRLLYNRFRWQPMICLPSEHFIYFLSLSPARTNSSMLGIIMRTSCLFSNLSKILMVDPNRRPNLRSISSLFHSGFYTNRLGPLIPAHLSDLARIHFPIPPLPVRVLWWRRFARLRRSLLSPETRQLFSWVYFTLKLNLLKSFLFFLFF